MTSEPIVLDTNVFVAAGFRPGSASGRIVQAVRTGELRMLWSAATRAETEAVLARIPPLDARLLLDVFREDDRFHGDIDPERFAAVPDPDDRKFAALAAASGATLITNDGHLLAATGSGFRAVEPGPFWRATRPAE